MDSPVSSGGGVVSSGGVTVSSGGSVESSGGRAMSSAGSVSLGSVLSGVTAVSIWGADVSLVAGPEPSIQEALKKEMRQKRVKYFMGRMVAQMRIWKQLLNRDH